jgi:hypothetical protein
MEGKKIMNLAEMRRVATGAVRSQLRRQGINPKTVDADSALRMLDDIYRVDPELIASLWYGEASNNQIKLFKKEWRQ